MFGLLWAASASAQTLPSPTPQFDFLGFIEDATLDTTNSICTPAAPLLAGGTVTVNGIKMIVPCNTILQMPANTITWAQLFDPTFSAAIPVTPSGLPGTSVVWQDQVTPRVTGAPLQRSGLALSDLVAHVAGAPMTPPGAAAERPFPSFEIRAAGNIVTKTDPVTGAVSVDYVVGLIAPISQQGLNIGFGHVRCVDYDNGFLYVGGAENGAGVTACTAANGVRIQMNDPIGRWGKAHSPDQRFSGDTNNTTMHTASGYPICLPRVAPPAIDPLCPTTNRPLNGDARFPVDPFLPTGAPLKAFDMPAPVLDATGANTMTPDAYQQLPVMVGDWLEYSGTLMRDGIDPGTGADLTFISAHTINDVLGVYTAPGVQPAYVGVEGILLGTGGLVIPGIVQEATNRIFIVGFTTDPTSLIDINALDYNPCTGAPSLRLLGTVDPLSQPVRGRFRFHVLGGAFMPPTREMVITSHNRTGAEPAFPLPGWAGPIAANGFQTGQYLLPNFDFIFPENHSFGPPIVPNNFQDLPFLALGSGPLFGLDTNPVVGQLDPWPGAPKPPAVTCVAGGASPILDLSGTPNPLVVNSGAQVTLNAKVTHDVNAGPLGISWTQPAGQNVALSSTTTLTPSFIAPVVPPGTPQLQLFFTINVADAFGSAVATVPVIVNPATATPADVVTATATWRAPRVGVNGVGGNKGGLLSVSATDNILNPAPTLFVDGFGPMSLDPVLGPGNYVLAVTGVSAPPATVTVHSSLGGQATATVLVR